MIPLVVFDKSITDLRTAILGLDATINVDLEEQTDINNASTKHPITSNKDQLLSHRQNTCGNMKGTISNTEFFRD